MKYFTKKIIAVLLTVMLTGITVLHVSGGQTIKVNAAQTFKVHFIDVGAADGALLQYGEGENAKYALIDSGAYSYETTDLDTIYGNPLEFEYLESSEDKEKQTEETARWTAFDTQTYQTFKKKLEKRNSYKDASLHIQYVVPQAGTSVKLGEAVMTFYGR